MFTYLKKVWKNNINKGFTLMETILVISIIAILLGIGAIGVAQYMDNADETERIGAAQTLYMSLQNYLLEEKKAGRLEQFNDMVNDSDFYTLFDYTNSLTNNTSEKSILEANSLSLDTTYINKHNGTKIVAVFYDGENKNQNKYKKIYDLFVSLGVDTGILDCQFLFEYNQTTGIVQSVFFTKEPGIKFSPNSYVAGALTNKNNVLDRSETAIDIKKQGYYGLFETSALSEIVEKAINEKVVLVNDDRIYLVFKSSVPNGNNNLNQKIQLHLKDGTPIGNEYHVQKSTPIQNNESISQVLDSLDSHTTSKKNNDKLLSARHIDLGDGNAIYFVVLSCLEDDLFLELAEKEGKKGVAPLGDHPEEAEVYISLTGKQSLKSNTINPFFESVTTEGTEKIYNLSCTRHLANLNNGKVINASLDWKKLHYRVVDNINMMQYEREERNLSKALSSVLGIKESELASVTKLNLNALAKSAEDSTSQRHFKNNVAPITFGEITDGMKYFDGIFEGAGNTDGTKTTITGITIVAEANKENGFFKSNKGTIQNLTFKKATIYSGFCAGVVCGRNSGTIQNVEVEDFVVAQESLSYKNAGNAYYNGGTGNEQTSIDHSYEIVNWGEEKINQSGNPIDYNGSMVGGVCGITYSSMKDCAVKRGIVYGVDSYGGGIVGWAYAKDASDNDRFSIDNCTMTDCFVSVSAKSGGIVGHSEFKISNCNVLKENDSELLPVGLSLGAKSNRLNAKKIYPCVVANGNELRAGGIAGSANNSIENCSNYLDVCQIFDKVVTLNATNFQNLGGIVGLLGDSKNKTSLYSIKDCINYGNVTAFENGALTKFVGGIAGMSCFPIQNCTNYGDIIGTYAECVGGIAGGSLHNIKNCKVYSNTANTALTISGNKYIGGIAGAVNGATIENCYVACDKSADENIKQFGNVNIIPAIYASPNTQAKYDFESIGGICGLCNADTIAEFSVISCVNYADIKADSKINNIRYCGGLLGKCYKTVSVTASYNYGNILANQNTGNMMSCGGLVGSHQSQGYYLKVNSSENYGNLNLASASYTMQYCGGIYGGGVESVGIMQFTNNCKNHGSLISSGKMDSCGGIFSCALTYQDHVFQNLYNYGNLQSTGPMTNVGGITAKLVPNQPNSKFDTIYNEGNIHSNSTCTDVAGIVAVNEQWNKISNVYNSGNITATQSFDKVGGIVGENTGSLLLENAENSGTLSAGTSVMNSGGVVGYLGDQSWYNSISFVSNSGNITSGTTMKHTGGIAGYCTKELTMSSTTNSGILTGTGAMEKCGGIVGEATTKLMLTTANNSGSIIATSTMLDVGGIAGYLPGYTNTLNSVTNAGALNASGNQNNVGGIVGDVTVALTLETVSNAGSISGNSVMTNVGGVAGYLPGDLNTFHTVSNTTEGTITGNGKMEYVGGIVGRAKKIQDVSEGNIVKNEGSINLKSTNTSLTCQFIGGIAGQLDQPLVANGLFNSGDITVSSCILQYAGGIIGRQLGGGTYSSYVKFKNTGKISSGNKVIAVGGILGHILGSSGSDTQLTIDSATNEGNITITGGQSIRVGGILGYSSEENNRVLTVKITSCLNKGAISVFRTGEKIDDIPGIGGVAGTFCIRKFDIQNTVNEGEISVTYEGPQKKPDKDTDKTERKKYLGGIIGCIARVTPTSANVSGCRNSGNLNVNYAAENIAGIIGCSNVDFCITVTNCENHGDAHIKDYTRNLSGIIGFAKGALVKNCTNYGDFICDENIDCVSGIVAKNSGNNVTKNKLTIQSCINYGNIYAKGYIQNAGGIVGYIWSPATIEDENLGNGSNPTKNLGSITAEGNLQFVGGILGNTSYEIYGNQLYRNVVNEGNLISNQGNLNCVGGIIGNNEITEPKAGAAKNRITNELYLATANCKIQGKNLTKVGGLIGNFYGSSGQADINGTSLQKNEITAEYREITVDIVATGSMNEVGALIGCIGSNGYYVRNYSFAGSITNSRSPEATYNLIGSKADFDSSAYHCDMKTKVLFVLNATDGCSWETDKVFVDGDANYLTTEDKTVTLTVTATDKEVDTIKFGDSTISVPSYVLDGTDKKYSIVIPTGTKACTISVTLKTMPTPIVFTLSSGSDYHWEDSLGTTITSVQIDSDASGTVTANAEVVYLIVTNVNKKLDNVTLNGSTLSGFSPTTLAGGERKYTVTIPVGSSADTVTAITKDVRKVTIHLNGLDSDIKVTALKSDDTEVNTYDSDDLEDEIVKFKVELKNPADTAKYNVNGTIIDASNPCIINFTDPSLTIDVVKVTP